MSLSKELKQAAYQLLSRREYSQKELNRKLLDKGFAEQEVGEVLEKLIDSDLQSDLRYADMVLRSRLNKGYGQLYIVQELKQKGINGQIINELFENQEIDWYLQAELAYNKRFKNTAAFDQKEKAKRVRYLQARGFSLEQVFSAINAAEDLH